MATNNETVGDNSAQDAQSVEFDASNLIAGLRDFLLRSVRENGMKKPWQKMSEGEQTLEIERATEKAEQIITDIVDLVAQGDFPVIHATVDNFKIKSGEVTITAKGIAEDEVVLTLNRVGVKAVKIVVADVNQFDQRRTNLKADPDEPGLPGVKLDLSAEGVNGQFDDEAEQAEGAAILELGKTEPAAPAHGPITDMKGFPNGPMQAMRDGNRWWSDDGLTWREATDDDVLPTDMDDVQQADLAFDPDEALPGIDDAGFDDEQDPAPEGEALADAIDDALGAQPWPDDAAIERQQADASAAGADPVAGEIPLNDTEADEIRDAGGKARKNGEGPKKNPHPAKSDRAKAWLEGYNAEKSAEATRTSGDADFDS